jgi:hypothetical protein
LKGNTGIRNTRSISLIRTLIALSNADPDRVGVVPWSTHVIDFHGGLTQADVKREIDSCMPDNPDNDSSLVFLDEVNTSAAGGYALNFALDATLVGKSFAFVAAVNQLEKMDSITVQLIRSGIPQKLPEQISRIRVSATPQSSKVGISVLKTTNRSKYAYNVIECPAPVTNFIICVERRSTFGAAPANCLHDLLTKDEE